MTKAYWVNTCSAIHDPERMARYAELAGPAMRAAGGTFLARGLPARVFEGPTDGAGGPGLRTVLIEFDSIAAAVDAYASPAYQEALAALGDGADREIRIVEAVE